MESVKQKPRESTLLMQSGMPMNEIEEQMQKQILEFGTFLDQK